MKTVDIVMPCSVIQIKLKFISKLFKHVHAFNWTGIGGNLQNSLKTSLSKRGNDFRDEALFWEN